MLVVPAQPRSLVEALSLSHALLSRADAEGSLMLAASVVDGPAVVLGAMQRAGRVLDLQACARAGVTVLRRYTTGTAAWIGGAGILLSLALPHVAALADDATHRTLLNRNVRPFLRAFTQAGAMAHYFGREWIALRKRPAALLGFDVTRQGAVLIDVIIGFDQSIALPVELTTAAERSLDRFMGKTPAGVREILPESECLPFAERLVQAMVVTSGANHFASGEGANHLASGEGANHFAPITNDMDPLPVGWVARGLERVPIGYIETAVCQNDAERLWVGGDVLAPRWLYGDVGLRVDPSTFSSVPIEGAAVEDLVRATRGLTS